MSAAAAPSMKYSSVACSVAMLGAAGTIAGLLLWAAVPVRADLLPRLLIAGAFALPIVFSLAGLARRRIYTAAWSSMLAVVYMAGTLAEYFVADMTPGKWLTLVCSSLLFAGSVLYPRLRAREGTA